MSAADPPPPPAVPLRAEAIAAGYRRQPVLSDVTLEVPKGRLTVLAGPNGSGKSTLLAALSRVIRPVQGCVLLDGQALAGLPTRMVAQKLALLPQSPLVPEGLSVYDLVARGRYPHHGLLRPWGPADDQAVAEALALTGLTTLADRPVEQLSGGQRQRCFIALVLAQGTETLLFDEPTTFLDLRYQIEVLDLIAALVRDHGRTVVMVLHDLNAALHYADRLVFLTGGRIHSVLERPEDCTAEQIHEVFGARMTRLIHPDTGKPAFLPAAGQGWS